MDRAIGNLLRSRNQAITNSAAELREARAVVAELIDAVEDHNEASDEYGACYDEDAREAWEAKVVARERLDAALVRIQAVLYG